MIDWTHLVQSHVRGGEAHFEHNQVHGDRAQEAHERHDEASSWLIVENN